MKICKVCGRKIGLSEYTYDGICEECYKGESITQEEKQERTEENIDNEIKATSSTNNVATIIKAMAGIIGVIGVIYGIITLSDSMVGMISIIGGFISAVFIYALGEIIQLLQDIKNK